MIYRLNLSQFGKVLIKFASSQLISNFLRLISGFLVVSLMDPAQYGQYTGIGVYLGYILLGQGGIINGLSREIPFELGQGNDEYAKKLASSVNVLVFFIGCLVFLAFITVGIISLFHSELLISIIYFSYAISGFFYLYNNQFLSALYRTNKDFNSLSRQNIRFGIGNLLTILLVYYWGIYGLIMRGVALAIYQFVLLYKNKPYKLEFKAELIHFKMLFKTGLPIFIVGYVNPLWSTVINNMIFAFGGALSFGLYSLSTIVEGTLKVIPTSFGGVIYPRMSIMYGEGKSVSEIIKANIKPLIFQFGFMLLVAVAGCFLLPVIVPYILPKYVDGIRAAQWMMFIPVALSFGSINHIYNVTKQQKWYFISLLIGVVIGSAFILVKNKLSGFDLVIFPQGLLLGKIVQQILSIFFIRFLYANENN